MKCIITVDEPVVLRRVTDDQADRLVRAGTHAYASKAAWKAAGRPDSQGQPQKPVQAKA